MKFLCLAYGDEAGWNTLSESERQEALAQDELIRKGDHFMTAVKPELTTVKNWDNRLEVKEDFIESDQLPLAGFSIIDADSVDEVVAMVSNTPCARARGYIEIRPFWELETEA